MFWLRLSLSQNMKCLYFLNETIYDKHNEKGLAEAEAEMENPHSEERVDNQMMNGTSAGTSLHPKFIYFMQLLEKFGRKIGYWPTPLGLMPPCGKSRSHH